MQEGLIGPHWSKGWMIEDNIISDSRNVGISIGKEESTGQNEWTTLFTKMGHQREQEVIFRAVNNGWSKDNIGSHIVRNNTIFNCGKIGLLVTSAWPFTCLVIIKFSAFLSNVE